MSCNHLPHIVGASKNSPVMLPPILPNSQRTRWQQDRFRDQLRQSAGPCFVAAARRFYRGTGGRNKISTFIRTSSLASCASISGFPRPQRASSLRSRLDVPDITKPLAQRIQCKGHRYLEIRGAKPDYRHSRNLLRPATTGHITAPPTRAMNLCRLICPPKGPRLVRGLKANSLPTPMSAELAQRSKRIVIDHLVGAGERAVCTVPKNPKAAAAIRNYRGNF